MPTTTNMTLTGGLTLGTALTAANGGTGITSLGTGVATALGIATTATGGFPTQTNNTSFTVDISFSTPGDVSISYSSRTASYSKNGNIVIYKFSVDFTPTYTTASGNLTISVPFAAASGSGSWCCSLFNSGGVNLTYPAGRSVINGVLDQATSVIYLRAMGSAVSATNLTTSNFTSGVAYTISGSMIYASA